MAFKHMYLYLGGDVPRTERQQCLDEGKEIASLEAEFAAVAALDLEDLAHQPRMEALMDRAAQLPMKPGYPYEEPSDLEGIRACRQDRPQLPALPKDEELADRIHGAWLGRVCGCILGKPMEGAPRKQIETGFKQAGAWPINDYTPFEAAMARYDEAGQKRERENFKKYGPEKYHNVCLKENIRFATIDDDTNYTVTGLAVLERFGPKFTPQLVANFWMEEIPIIQVFTAERVAYRNFVRLIGPPESGRFRNPYREWIGAQIRADAWGYACPGNPELAAEYAWRDACISHVKNGIYGEMFVAAMLAAAATGADRDTVLAAGLGEIPARSRLHEAIRAIIADYRAGVTYDEAVNKLCARWDETFVHHLIHTISNAEIVVIGLLYGEGDYGQTICRALQPGLDTDCNCATAGSIMGMMLGAAQLPDKWTGPIHDTLLTSVRGFERVSISDMAQRTLAFVQRCVGQAG